jgi:hypothetical protein
MHSIGALLMVQCEVVMICSRSRLARPHLSCYIKLSHFWYFCCANIQVDLTSARCVVRGMFFFFSGYGVIPDELHCI